MGIGSGNQGLWFKISSSEKIVRLSQLRDVLRTDRDPKIAFDTSIFVQATIAAIWSNIFNKNSSGKKNIESGENLCNLNEDYIITEVRKKLEETNAKFRKCGMIPVWCMEGLSKNNDKLAKEKRKIFYGKTNDNLIYYYLKAKIAMGQNAESIERVKKLSIIEKIIDRASFDPNSIVVDYTKENFSTIYSTLLVTLSSTEVRTKRMMEEIYNVFKSPSFEVLYVPEIVEAEKLCVILTHIGYCEAVYSTDSDTIVLGAKHVFFKKRLTKEEKTMEKYKNYESDTVFSFYSYYEVISDLKMTPEKLLIFSILLGNDFNRKVSGDGIGTIETRHLSNPSFDIYKYNLDNCGTLNPDICFSFLTISNEEKKLVRDRLIGKNRE